MIGIDQGNAGAPVSVTISRPMDRGWLCGICAALANHYRQPVELIRPLTIALTLFVLWAALAYSPLFFLSPPVLYFLLRLFIPREGGDLTIGPRPLQAQTIRWLVIFALVHTVVFIWMQNMNFRPFGASRIIVENGEVQYIRDRSGAVLHLIRMMFDPGLARGLSLWILFLIPLFPLLIERWPVHRRIEVTIAVAIGLIVALAIQRAITPQSFVLIRWGFFPIRLALESMRTIPMQIMVLWLLWTLVTDCPHGHRWMAAVLTRLAVWLTALMGLVLVLSLFAVG